MAVVFGPFRLEPAERRLVRDGLPVEVQDQVIEVLVALTERPGGLWTRDELHARLWPDAIVSEDALFQAVAKARKALGDPARKPVYIATVAGQGYRFLAPVQVVAAPAAPPVAGAVTPPPTRLVGRDALVARLRADLGAGPGLWTLTGPGGVGKTRLSRELAVRLFGELPGGALFCDLQQARDRAGVLTAVGHALHVAPQRLGEVEAVADELASRGDALLVFDNGEQVAAPLAEVTAALLQAAPRARLLVTSRARLGLAGERLVEVSTLPLPAVEADLVALRDSPAGALLLDRAADVGVSPEPAQAGALAALTHRLGGLPLALELAAPRLRLLSPEQLLARMDRHLDLLGAPPGSRPDRHASLRSAIAASWDLLDRDARAALAQVSVFPGPFSAEAAEAVLDVDADPIEVLAVLVDHSLVRRTDDQPPRLELLPGIRAFAAEQLADRAAVLDRLAAWLAAPGRFDPHPDRAGVEAGLLRDTLLLALAHAAGAGRHEQAADLAVALVPALLAEGPLQVAAATCARARLAGPLPPSLARRLLCAEAEARLQLFETPQVAALLDQAEALGPDVGVDHLRVTLLHHSGRIADAITHGRAALARSPAPTPDRARLLLAVAAAERYASELDASEQHLAEASAIVEAHDLQRARVAVLVGQSVLAFSRGQVRESLALAERALERLHGTRHRLDQAAAHERAGTALLFLGELDRAEAHLVEAERLCRQAGSTRGIAYAVEGRARLATFRGDLGTGEALYRQAAAAFTQAGLGAIAAVVRGNLGQVLARQGKLDEAEAMLEEALAGHDSTRRDVGFALHNLGMVALLRGDLAKARARMEAARAESRRVANTRMEMVSQGYLAQVELAAGAPERALELLPEVVAHAQALGLHQALGRMQSLLGTALARVGRREEARAAFAAGEATLRERGMQEDLGLLLCRAGRAHLDWGEVAAARACLDEATGLARACAAPADGELHRERAELAAALGAAE